MIDSVSSYHLYVPFKYKKVDLGNFKRAFNGFNSTGLGFHLLWTLMLSNEKHKLKKDNPSQIAFFRKKELNY